MYIIPCETEDDGFLPTKAYEGTSAAFDLKAYFNFDKGEGQIIIPPLGRHLISTAVKMNIPEGMVGMVCPRSGLALNKGITVLNAPGVIDPGYVNTVGVILINLGSEPVTITHGDKIAQLLIVDTQDVVLSTSRKLDTNTIRGYNGYGSSDKT